MPEDDPAAKKQPPSVSERASKWIGTAGAVVTVGLTVWNARLNDQLQRADQRLKEAQQELQARAQAVEESRERVSRYTWVHSLLVGLDEEDERARNLTLTLVRLALSKDEAELLFTGLQSSNDETLQSAGRSGLNNLAAEPLARLIADLDAASRPERARALQQLIDEYDASAAAIQQMFRRYVDAEPGSISPTGVINGLYFLNRTRPEAWTPELLVQASALVADLEARGPGPQTQAELDTLKVHLRSVAGR